MKSKYVHIHRHKLPHHRRSQRVHGAEEENGKYIKCWNCGFIVDTTRDLGSSDSSGVSVVEADSDSYPYEGSMCSLDYPSMIGDVDLLDGGGTERVTYSPKFSSVSRGCPFCGTTNLP